MDQISFDHKCDHKILLTLKSVFPEEYFSLGRSLVRLAENNTTLQPILNPLEFDESFLQAACGNMQDS